MTVSSSTQTVSGDSASNMENVSCDKSTADGDYCDLGIVCIYQLDGGIDSR